MDESQRPESEKKFQWLGGTALALVFLFGLFSCAIIYHGVIRVDRLPQWDEATYLFSASKSAHHLFSGEWSEFYKFTMQHLEKPFFFSWMLGPVLQTFGHTTLSARSFVLLLYFASAFLVLLATMRIRPGPAGRLGGAAAAALFLAAPISVNMSAQVMLEMPGAFLTLVAMLLYLNAQKKNSRRARLFAGLSVGALFLVKYNYGCLLLCAAILDLCLTRKEDRWSQKQVAEFLGPFVLVLILWFADPFSKKLNYFFSFALNRASEPTGGFFSRLLFYPEAIWKNYATGHVAFVLLVLSVLAGLLQWRNRKLRFVLLVFITGMAISTLHDYQAQRFIFTIAPALFICFGSLVALYYEMLAKRGKAGCAGLALALIPALIFLPAFRSVVTSAHEHRQAALAAHDPELSQALDRLADFMDPEGRNLVIGEFNELSPSLIHFQVRSVWDKEIKLRIGTRTPEEIYTRTGTRAEAHPSIGESLAKELRWKPDVVVLLSVPPESRYETMDYKTWNDWKRNLRQPMQKAPGYSQEQVIRYPGNGLELWVFHLVENTLDDTKQTTGEEHRPQSRLPEED